MLMMIAINRAGTVTTPSGWSLLGSVSDGADVRSWLYARTAAAGDSGALIEATLDAYAKTAVHLVVYSGAAAAVGVTSIAEAGNTAVHQAPAGVAIRDGSTVVRFWAAKGGTPHPWTLNGGFTSRASTAGGGGGLLNSTIGDSTGHHAGPVAASSADAGQASAKAISWTVVLARMS